MLTTAAFCLFPLFAEVVPEPMPERSSEEVRLAILQLKVPPGKIYDASGEKVARRLNAALDRLSADFERFSKDRKFSVRRLETLWVKMGSVEGRSAVYPEFLVQLLLVSDAELLRVAEKLQLIESVPASSKGCCAIEGYYRFNHESTAQMPDPVILALATHLASVHTRAEKGFHHGIMIELVDRGFRESYNGYKCVNNKARGCRITE